MFNETKRDLHRQTPEFLERSPNTHGIAKTSSAPSLYAPSLSCFYLSLLSVLLSIDNHHHTTTNQLQRDHTTSPSPLSPSLLTLNPEFRTEEDPALTVVRPTLAILQSTFEEHLALAVLDSIPPRSCVG
ncbi:hypothetical protein C1H46_000417 [Malus baccata]|uniref:Uncharacterized protein n=1 Tax=Malus baccata TaxID=106549 RepID=A0A540NSQ8_MALBA|nr:hypothetical protein C1H46_000417 [Malus baccata]